MIVEEIDVPGATLWTASQGAGPALVLCHGGPGLSDNLGPVAEMVDDLALVHRYDQCGSGRSRSDGPFEVASFVADLDALRRHWGHERWLVGGHSWGANLALCYALAHPDQTTGVLYMAGSTADPERFLQLMWTTDFADRRQVRLPLYQWPRNETIYNAVNRSFQDIVDHGLPDQMRRLEAPILVIHGAHDAPARAREVAELAPHGRWVELERSAHVPWLEEPAHVRELLRAFIREP